VIDPTPQDTGGAGVSPATSKTSATKKKSATSETKSSKATGPTGGTGTSGSTGTIGSTGTTGAPDVPAIPRTGGSAHLGNRVLKEGDDGHDVRVLQNYLTVVGDFVDVTGSFGSSTLHRVEVFQQDQGEKPNGIMSYSDAYALRVAEAQVETAPVERARINSNGLAVAPADAPAAIKEVIAWGNKIAHKPYIYGGGHQSWNSAGYDCSGSVSYALHGADLIASPEDSGEMESYGLGGSGRWITLYTNAGHVYMHIAGLWFDTAAQSSANHSDRWSKVRISPAGGFIVRHPPSF
jgi:cell wall-associated NlpC family hydrolase